jgi:serine/threonine protein phosphatase 1
MAPRRHIIVGDVHGMTLELKALVKAVELTKDDVLVFVGDLVDKGPDSAGTVAFARELREAGFTVVFVLGNHEEKHARFRKAFAKAGDKVKMNGLDELKAITAALSDADIEFLESAVPFHRIPEHNAVVVHGGILPVMETLDVADKAILGRLLRTRHVTGSASAKVTIELTLDGMSEDDIDCLSPAALANFSSAHKVVRKSVRPAGSFVSLGQETENDPFWADVYDGRFGHVFFGHSPFLDSDTPVLFPHATGLDLGAVFGNKLAAAVLEVGKPQQSVVVEATGKFATSMWED